MRGYDVFKNKLFYLIFILLAFIDSFCMEQEVEDNYDIYKFLDNARKKNKYKKIFKNNHLVENNNKEEKAMQPENYFNKLPPDNAIIVLIAIFLLPTEQQLKHEQIEIQDIYRDIASFLRACKRFYNIRTTINEFVVKELSKNFPISGEFEKTREDIKKINPIVDIVHICMVKKEDKNQKLKDIENSKVILGSFIIKNRYNPDLIKNLSLPDTIRRTPIQWAAAYNQYKTIKALVKLGVSLNSADITGTSPLHEAVRKNCLESVKALLENGADKETRNNLEETALHIACKHNCAAIIKLLLDFGAKPDSCNRNGETPLHILVNSVSNNNILIIEYILKNTWADPNAQDISGETPLHNAVYQRNFKAAELLIKNGATNIIKNNINQKPTDVAKAVGDYKMANFIKDRDNKCNVM